MYPLKFVMNGFTSVNRSVTKIMEPLKMQALSPKITINVKGKLLLLDKPLVMGIINTTPDSFHRQSRQADEEAALKQASQMLADGATMIDVGGYSSRPGATEVSQEEELNRVIPVVEALNKNIPDIIISIDTFRARVAEAAVLAGAAMVNDISAGEDDSDMLTTVARLQVPYILMHKQGNPQTMQQNPQYRHIVTEVIDYLKQRVEACNKAGIKDLIIDPGFGFGKNLEHNYTLFKALSDFQLFGLPVLVGISRKSMIQKLLKVDTAHALNGSTVLHTLALTKGATILRVHDVKEAVECINIVNAVNGTI